MPMSAAPNSLQSSIHPDAARVETERNGRLDADAGELFTLPAAQMRVDSGARGFWRKVGAVAAKDIRSELRAKEVLGTMAAFSVLAVIIFGIAFDLAPRLDLLVPGVVWSILLFAGVLGLHRSFGSEVDRGSMSALLLAPVDRSAIYFGKVIANLTFMLVSQALVLPIVLILFDVSLFQPWILTALLLGLIGYVSVGTLFAALTANVRARETMLPILLLPVMAPIFVAGVGLTGDVLAGDTFADIRNWLGMLAGYDLFFVTIAFMVFDMIWDDM